jgi:sec-independent protein translocase protein TatA
MGALAPWHWVVLIVVILLIFGGRLIPRLGGSLGRSISGLKQGLKDGSEQFKSAVTEEPGSSKPAAAESHTAEKQKSEES